MLTIGNRYKKHKDNVIDLFEDYKKTRGEINDGVDIIFLESRIRSLKEGKFILAVAGEVKAGKSTFINALIGSEILPMDVLQATSTVIEIFKSEKSFLKIKYASGREEEVYDDITTTDIEEAREKLKVLCSIQDEYRSIPTGLLNKYILSSKERIIVDDHLIASLEKECDFDNLNSNSLSAYKNLINNYIIEHSPDNIPSEIQYGYPLEWDFDELRIVDTPGVNALGGVQDVSFNYFEKANAILFIKKIDSIELKSFNSFVNSLISNRSSETLFLVLTHKSQHIDNEDRLLKQAKEIYTKNIQPERILVVDSLSKIIHTELKNGKDFSSIKSESGAKADVINLYKGKAEDKGLKFSENIFLEWSGFDKMIEVIDRFSTIAPNLQLTEILEIVRKGYFNQKNQYEEKSSRLEDKKRNPQEFEQSIVRITNALNEYNLVINETNEELKKQFSGRKSKLNLKIGELKIKYPELITKSQTDESVRKCFFDSSYEINSLILEYSKDISDSLNRKIVEKEKAFKNEYKITLPNVDLESIEHQATAKAYKNIPVFETRTESLLENWNIFKFNWTKKSRTKSIKVGDKNVFDDIKYLEVLKTLFNKEFYIITDSILVKSNEVLSNYLDDYNNKMLDYIEERKTELEMEKNNKQTNQEIIDDILIIKKKIELFEPELNRIEEILGDLK